MPAGINVAEIYELHGRVVLAILYARCCDRDLALEALQESFLRLQEARHDAIHNVPAWLVRVGQNWLIDVQRKKRPVSAGDQIDLWLGKLIEPHQHHQERELLALVQEGIGRLSIEDREVLVLRYGCDWDSARIGEALCLNSTAVDMRLSRARKRLGEKLRLLGVTHYESIV